MTADKAYLRLFQYDEDDLSSAEIRQLLDAELSDPDPDTDLIEACLDALDGAGIRSAALKGKTKRISVKTAAIAAAAVFLLLLCCAAATAKLAPGIFGPFVDYYNDRIRIGHETETDPDPSTAVYALLDTPLAKQLAQHGISPVLLPKELTDGKYDLDDVRYEATEIVNSANIRFSGGKTEGTLIISTYGEASALPVMDYESAVNAEILETERFTAYLFTQGSSTVVDFSYGNALYSIIFDGDRDAAVSFAGSMQ
ncbi:MAG: hypothetical protein IJK02_06710 [Clostridia bacterium]|nr:hypothetical protein [Clostridia bacterium]